MCTCSLGGYQSMYKIRKTKEMSIYLNSVAISKAVIGERNGFEVNTNFNLHAKKSTELI